MDKNLKTYMKSKMYTGNRSTLRSTGNEHNIGNPLYWSNNHDSDTGVGFAEETKSTGK